MRILHVIESLELGGAERALLNVLPSLAQAGNDVEVAALWGPYPLAADMEAGGVAVHRLDIGHRWNIPAGTAKLVRLLRRGRYDVVHAHLFFSTLYVAASKPWAPGARRVATFHNLGFDSYPHTGAWRRARKSLQRWFTRRGFDATTAVSDAVARHYDGHLRLPPSVIIPNAVVVVPGQNGDRKEDTRARFGLSPQAFVAVMPARFVPEKGHRYLLDALAELRRRDLRPDVILLGTGPVREAVVRRIEELGLSDQARIHPTVPHQELVELLRAADAFVSSSTFEGSPLSIAEALSLETPVLATAVGGVPELVEDGVSGILVAPGDASALAEGLARLMTDEPLRRRLAAAGRDRIRRRQAPEVVARELVELYRRLGP
jgi:glycosyltransferase involved in cell wall biosynthesis